MHVAKSACVTGLTGREREGALCRWSSLDDLFIKAVHTPEKAYRLRSGGRRVEGPSTRELTMDHNRNVSVTLPLGYRLGRLSILPSAGQVYGWLPQQELDDCRET